MDKKIPKTFSPVDDFMDWHLNGVVQVIKECVSRIDGICRNCLQVLLTTGWKVIFTAGWKKEEADGGVVFIQLYVSYRHRVQGAREISKTRSQCKEGDWGCATRVEKKILAWLNFKTN